MKKLGSMCDVPDFATAEQEMKIWIQKQSGRQ